MPSAAAKQTLGGYIDACNVRYMIDKLGKNSQHMMTSYGGGVVDEAFFVEN